MRVKFIRPRTQGHGRRSVERTINAVPAIGSKVAWDADKSFTVASIEYSMNVTPGQKAPGKASASITLE